MSRNAHRWITALLIVTGASGCDNVEWAGADVRLQPPPPASLGGGEPSEEEAEADSVYAFPEGPVLYMGTRDSTGLRLAPVAEIVGDSLRPLTDGRDPAEFRARFAQERMADGTEFVLFAEGVRVGTLRASSVDTDATFCPARPTVGGVVELVPGALEARNFLALEAAHARDVAYRPYVAHEHDRGQRLAGLDLFGTLIPQVEARWPSNVATARVDMQAFRYNGDGPRSIAETFVFRDQRAIAPTTPSAYAMFILSVARGDEFPPSYVWYRVAGRDGKGVPIYFEQLDWDGDGEAEVLLEVLGERRRWPAALDRRGDDWVRIYQEPCGEQAEPPSGDEGG